MPVAGERNDDAAGVEGHNIYPTGIDRTFQLPSIFDCGMAVVVTAALVPADPGGVSVRGFSAPGVENIGTRWQCGWVCILEWVLSITTTPVVIFRTRHTAGADIIDYRSAQYRRWIS